MRHHIETQLHRRRGTVAVLACLLMVAMLGMVAFAIDIGYLATSQTELQRSADASALAACCQLVYRGTPGTPVDLTTNVQNAPIVAGQYAGWNNVCKSAPSLAGTDVVVGYMANPTVSGGTINTAANQNLFNSVQVTVRRNSTENGQIPTFFGKVFGVNGTNASATATAAFIANVGGFGIPQSSSGPTNLMLLPFALDQQTWNAMLAGDTTVSTDVWNYNSSGQVVAGSDGIREVNLFPQGTGSPGNRGTVDIGAPNNSTADVVRQIIYGISPSDMAYFPNSELKFDTNGHLYLNADPGISAGFKAALESIIGQTRFIPIFTTVVGNGNTATYEIVAFVGVRIMAVKLTGSMNSKYLTVQPALVYTRGALPNTTTTATTGYYIYSPIFLVK